MADKLTLLQVRLKVCPCSPWRACHHGFSQRVSPLPIADTPSAAADLSAPDDLISLLKVIAGGRYRRGVRYAQWLLHLVAVLGILSGCRPRDLEAFAKLHR